jgi:hypothetical protein
LDRLCCRTDRLIPESLPKVWSGINNLTKPLELIQAEAGGCPDRVFRLGRARVVGYAAHLLRDDLVASALQLIKEIGFEQPLETLRMLTRIVGHRLALLLMNDPLADAEIGGPFQDADPCTIPWGAPMLMPEEERRRLVAADADRMRNRKSPHPARMTKPFREQRFSNRKIRDILRYSENVFPLGSP